MGERVERVVMFAAAAAGATPHRISDVRSTPTRSGLYAGDLTDRLGKEARAYPGDSRKPDILAETGGAFIQPRLPYATAGVLYLPRGAHASDGTRSARKGVGSG